MTTPTSLACGSAFVVTEPGTDQLLDHQGGSYVAPAGNRYGRVDGVWDFIRPDRRELINTFARDYAAVRQAEQRTPMTAEAVRELPYKNLSQDLSGDASRELTEMWQKRAESFDRFRSQLVSVSPGTMVDLGAGCGWLGARLAADGWSAAAVDVTVDGGDGLATGRWHEHELFLVRAEMDVLPFATGSIDLVVCNASLHYAPDVSTTLAEAVRVARPGGLIAIMDSPIFSDSAAGTAMVEEFVAATKEQHGVVPAAHFGQGFVAEADLDRFRQHHKPKTYVRCDDRPGVIGKLRSTIGARRAGREIAKRPLILVETKTEESS